MSPPRTGADALAALSERALALQQAGRLAEALEVFDHALALAPDRAETIFDRGVVLHDLMRHEEALASYRRVLAIAPRFELAHYACGMALADMNRDEEAVQAFGAAIAIKPDYADAHVLRAFSWLRMGRFDLGWRAYEWRKARWPSALPRLDPRTAWRGQADLAGKTLFLHHEQGLGDSIQFIRYARLLASRGARTVLSVQDALRPLLRPLFPGLDIIGESERPARFDYHCSLLSLPLAFATTLDSIPSPGPYLSADPARRARVEALLGPRVRPRVGLAWSGHPNHPNDRHRSMPFAALAPLLAWDADWIALQNDLRSRDGAAVDHVAFHRAAQTDFADTAALVDLMDLVITVDTSIAHLAGALGKTVVILLPFACEWRWLRGRADSPWYAGARLVRQSRAGDWAGVVARVDGDLPSLVPGLNRFAQAFDDVG